MNTTLETFSVTTPDGRSHPAAALVPPSPVGTCLFLYGGGGSRDTLAESRPLWDRWLGDQVLPPLIIATASVRPFGFYLDAPDHLDRTLVGRTLPEALRSRYGVAGPPALFGISMGGHAALSLLLEQPERFGPTAVLQPMVEPGCSPEDSPQRCRSHYPPGVPEAYLGAERTQAAWQAHHPAWVARRTGAEGLATLPPLYLEAAAADRFHAQEGASFLHEVLDELGAAHHWVWSEGADHIGASVVPRMNAAAAWLGGALGAGSEG